MIKFSIVIPVKAINDYIRETVSCIQRIPSDDWELVILPNDQDPDEWQDRRIRIISSGAVGPAKKRDLGAKFANGAILVFLDDDSYPEPDLFVMAAPHFEDSTVVALGGPAITPRSDSFWQRVSGAVFLSKFSGGAPERYVPVGHVRPVKDWPSVNLMVRRAAFLEVGGFNSPYWPGEDTKLCLDLIQKTGGRILYIPEMKVWHHRRTGLAAHLRQVGGYGLHRGYFAKCYPATSLRVMYFFPSAFVIFSLTSVFATVALPSSASVFLLGWVIYVAALARAWYDIRKHESPAVAMMAIFYTFTTHWWYGLRFIQGLLTRNLVSQLR